MASAGNRNPMGKLCNMAAFASAVPLSPICTSGVRCNAYSRTASRGRGRRFPRPFAHSVRSAVTIRPATQHDAEAAAACMARAFRGEESYRDPIARWLVTRVSSMDMSAQLSRRLAGIGEWESAGREAGRQDVAASCAQKEHVLLVAEDEDVLDGIIGCVEMGVVNVPRLFANGMLDEIDQWGLRSDAAAVARLDAVAHSATSSLDNVSNSSTTDSGCEEARAAAKSPLPDSNTEGSAVKRKRSNVDLPYIGNLAVDARVRRQGLARQLMQAAESEALSWGYTRVCLHVDAACVPATRLYAALGYECSAREPVWHPRVGRIRRLFLARDIRGDIGCDASKPVETTVAEWESAEVETVGTKLTLFEYLRLCLSGFGEKGSGRARRRK